MIPWFVAIVIQTVRDVRSYHRPPVPSEFVASGLLFGGLAVIGEYQPSFAQVMAWGVIVAMVLQTYERTGKGVLHTQTPGQVKAQTGGVGGGR